MLIPTVVVVIVVESIEFVVGIGGSVSESTFVVRISMCVGECEIDGLFVWLVWLVVEGVINVDTSVVEVVVAVLAGVCVSGSTIVNDSPELVGKVLPVTIVDVVVDIVVVLVVEDDAGAGVDGWTELDAVAGAIAVGAVGSGSIGSNGHEHAPP